MEKLITNLDPNLGATLREQLGDNFQKIQNGVDGQSDSLNKQILDMLGDVPLQDKDEVTQARVDSSGKAYSTLKGRLDSQQSSADTALREERAIGLEVEDARSDSSGETFDDLKSRLDSQESKIDNRIDNKLAQISSVPETFTNLAALKNAYPNGRTGIFVTADTGHKYIWTNNTWTDAGIYQSAGVADGSITPNKLAGEAIPVTFVPSRDGLVNYDTATSTIDFNCIHDNAYVKYYDKYIQIPSNQKLVIDPDNRSSGYISVDIDTGVPTLINAAIHAAAENSVVLGYYRIFSNNKIAFYGAIATAITVDGHRNASNITHGEGISVAFSPNGKGNYDTTAMTLDFNAKKYTLPTIYFDGGQHSIPEGTIAKPSKLLSSIGTAGSVKVGYNLVNDTASIFNWNEDLPDGYFSIGAIQRGNGGFSTNLDITIDGVIQPNDNPVFTPSKDGNPWIDFDRKVIDFNCINDQAYIRYNQKVFQLPKNFTIDISLLISLAATSFVFVFRPATGLIELLSWSLQIPDGTFPFASIRATADGGYKTHGITIDYSGFSSQEVPTVSDENILAIAHRGYNIAAPEESKASYVMAANNGYRNWEGDIHFTSDGVPVMHHDETINRIARNADGSAIANTVTISQTSLAQIDTYDFGIYKSPNYAGTKIMRFADFVNLARRYDADIHVELKEAFTRDQKQQLLDIVKKEHMIDRTGWQAFDWTWLEDVKELSPTSQLELLGPTVFDDDFFTKFASYQTSKNNVVASVGSGVSIADIQILIDRDIDVYVWTVDNRETARKFASVAVKGLMTNGGTNIHAAVRMP